MVVGLGTLDFVEPHSPSKILRWCPLAHLLSLSVHQYILLFIFSFLKRRGETH
ncbi:hypothetical protein OIU84_007021 [Salix udensis]|uniref:Uncharacterized protein n=1 Tax=Salix udensis TaxID=889485 RepID=A0AAD6K0M5_9ROSI|nr:hypothetical protein OIU84_007021 [Salix udensis]